MRKRLATLDVFSGCGGLSHGLHEAGVAESRMDQNVAGGSPLQCGGRAKGGRRRREGGRGGALRRPGGCQGRGRMLRRRLPHRLRKSRHRRWPSAVSRFFT